jgi:hypothetical protein
MRPIPQQSAKHERLPPKNDVDANQTPEGMPRNAKKFF